MIILLHHLIILLLHHHHHHLIIIFPFILIRIIILRIMMLLLINLLLVILLLILLILLLIPVRGLTEYRTSYRGLGSQNLGPPVPALQAITPGGKLAVSGPLFRNLTPQELEYRPQKKGTRE